KRSGPGGWEKRADPSASGKPARSAKPGTHGKPGRPGKPAVAPSSRRGRAANGHAGNGHAGNGHAGNGASGNGRPGGTAGRRRGAPVGTKRATGGTGRGR
ncbi:MAG: hypothetical protein ABSF33_17775, partial [Acidimicrobiales bacterium]